MWDVVESDFGGDETTNFGPRKESGTALYQIDTLATISSREKVSGSAPHIVSAVLGELACLAVGAHLSVFKDCQFAITLGFGLQSFLYTWICFVSQQEVPLMSWNGAQMEFFLVIGDRGGNLTILDADSFETIFAFKAASKTEEESKTYKKISFHQKKDDVYDLLVLTAEGQVLVIHDINTDLFTSGALWTLSTDVVSTEKEQSRLTTEVWHCGQLTETLHIGHCLRRQFASLDKSLVLFSSLDSVVWESVSNPNHLQKCIQSEPFTEVYTIRTVDRNVSNPDRLQKCIKLDGLQKCIKLDCLRSVSNPDCIQKCIQLDGLQNNFRPSFNGKYLPSGGITILNFLFNVLNLCFSNPGHVSTVRFRCLTETNPETRLARLLQKNKFEEAEFFAKAYGLDMEVIQKVKTNSLLDKLSPWNLPKYGADVQEKMMAQLWSSLRLIKDDLHVAGNCMRAALPTLSATQEMLDYCKKWLIKIAASGDNDQLEKQQKLLTKLLTIQHRLTTYQMAFGSDAYSGDSWDQFMAADLLQETLLWFDKRKINIGFQIWARHQNEWDKKMSASYVEHILLSIPEDVDSFEILGSICDSVIPYVVRVLPNSLSTVVDWITQRAENMELLEKSKWPSNAIQFLHFIHSCVQDVLKVTHKDSACTAYDNANKIGLIAKNTIQPLQALIRNLQHLHDLQTKYRETPRLLAFRMLDKVVAIELIEQDLEQHDTTSMKQHKLKEVSHLLQICQDHLELQEYEELQKTLKKIYSLQIEYNNYMTISEYRDAEYRKEIFVKYVKEIFTESEDSKKLSKMKIYRLAHIMQIPRAELQGQLAIEAATNRDIKTAVGICSELFQSDPTDETAQILFQVALSFQHLQADAEVDICNDNKLRELPELTLKLASQALTICSTDMLMQCLELYKVAHLTQSVIQQCETGDYSLCVETLGAGSTKPTSTPYKDWTMSPQFKEDALVMNSGTILPLVSQYTVAHPLLADQEPETSDVAPDMSRSLYNKVVPVIQHLKENNQIQLAYRFLLHYTSITVQFIDISAEQLAKGSSQKLQLSFVLSLIQKIFSCNAVDHMLALTYLITLQSKDSRQCLEYAYTAATSNHKRLMGIATVGTAFGSLFEDTDLITMNKQMETNASWGYRLSKAKITIKSALGGPLADRFKLLHQIAPSPLIDLQVVKDFCRLVF
ncbi:hypothetical protein ScPMuIL_014980 [Solemya velum]